MFRLSGRALRHSALVGLVCGVCLFGAQGADATTFDATLAVTVREPTPTVHWTVRLTLQINGASHESLFAIFPPGWEFAPDAEVPDLSERGSGGGDWEWTMSLPCRSYYGHGYSLQDASTDVTNTIDFFDALGDDDGDGWLNGVARYPAFLNTLFPGLKPRARLWGDNLEGVNETVLQLLVFEPGTEFPGGVRFDPALGTPVAIVVQDPTQRILLPKLPIRGRCFPFYLSLRFPDVTRDEWLTPANESVVSLVRPAGPVGDEFRIFTRSERDADDDTWVNHLDFCPLTPNPYPEWNPFDLMPDADLDFLPDACDPDPAPSKRYDEDADGLSNLIDNCRLDANPEQVDGDRDDIGDACDPDPVVPTGHYHETCVVASAVMEASRPDLPPSPGRAVTDCLQPAPTPTPSPAPTASPTPAPTMAPGALPGTGGGGGRGGGWRLALVAAGALLAAGGVLWRGRRRRYKR